MDRLISTSDSAEQYQHGRYTVIADAIQGERGQWRPRIEVSADGEPVTLDAPDSIGPYWATRDEAIRAGLERARYLLDKRDGVIDGRNPGRRGM
ncbi:DUF6566 family protein [Paraburkholderia sp.]|uniref:DUF6566 family protein n=1 Tax=Paraburkholderia sp. TaxID=1926495 RepID=UPI002F3F1CC6